MKTTRKTKEFPVTFATDVITCGNQKCGHSFVIFLINPFEGETSPEEGIDPWAMANVNFCPFCGEKEDD